MSKKDFKFSLRTNSGKLIAQQIVTFGSKEKPFPEDWQNSGVAISALLDFETEFQNKYAPVTYEEGSELDPYPEYDAIEVAAEKKYNDGSNIVMDVDISDSLQTAFIDGAMSNEAKAYWYNLFVKDQKPCEEYYDVKVLDKLIEIGDTKLLDTFGLTTSFLEKFTQWRDIEDQSIIDFVLAESKTMEPVYTSNSFHVSEEQYNIDGETYRLLFIGDGKTTPTVQIKNKQNEN